ncbi:hypothetical protein AEGHOMDF_5992 [Methylobacterium soli]|nr:hypothetical protein AEGHOMDF_5992 [Methylobacterium soli]
MARAAGARADRELAGDLALGARREGAGLLVAHMHPLDLAASPDRLRDGVEAVANNPEDPLDADLLQGLDDKVRDVGDAHGSAP